MNPSQIVNVVVILSMVGFVVYLVKKYKDQLSNGNEIAKGILKGVRSWTLLFIEILMVFFFVTEGLIAASLASAKITEVDSTYWARLLLHLGISLLGAVVGVSTFHQFVEAIQTITEFRTAADDPIGYTIRLVKQVFIDIPVFTLVPIASAIATLFLIGSGADQTNLFVTPYQYAYETTQWFKAGAYSIMPLGFVHIFYAGSYLVKTSAILTMFHLVGLGILILKSTDEALVVLGITSSGAAVPIPAPAPAPNPIPSPAPKPSGKARGLDNVIRYWVRHTGLTDAEIRDWLNSDPTEKSSKVGDITQRFKLSLDLENDIAGKDPSADISDEKEALKALHEAVKDLIKNG